MEVQNDSATVLEVPIANEQAVTDGQLNDDSHGSDKRERSTIKFPYWDLMESMKVAQSIRDLGGDVEIDQLAPNLGHETTRSGALSTKLASAQTFGLIQRDGSKISLSEIGKLAVSSEFAARGKVAAFLCVELYKKVYESYKGGPLPSDTLLEDFMKRQGVAAKQTDKARQAMKRSAQTAGFFDSGKDRLVAPITAKLPPEEEHDGSRGNREELPPPSSPKNPPLAELHPAVSGMIEGLPKVGEPWDDEKIEAWIAAFKPVLQFFHREKSTKS